MPYKLKGHRQVNLPKFKKTKEELSSIEDKWLYLLKHAADENQVPQGIVEQEIVNAYNTLERFNWDTGEYDAYVQSSIAITDEYRCQSKRYKEGLKEGEAKGLKEGKKQIALELLKAKQEPNLIATVTGLSVEEILALN